MKSYIVLGAIAGFILFLFVVQSFVTSSTINQLELDALQESIERERLIDNAIDQSIRDNPNGDPNISLQRLRELQVN